MRRFAWGAEDRKFWKSFKSYNSLDTRASREETNRKVQVLYASK